MDSRFTAAREAISAGDVDRLAALLEAEPSLSSDRSSDPHDHPTLLQCLVLATLPAETLEAMVELLIRHGAEPDGPLVAAAGVDNVRAVNKLLDLGANIEGPGEWTPLDEALYWGSPRAVEHLLARGAKVDNLRTAAALGRLEQVRSYFPDAASLVPNPAAGVVAWPFVAKPVPEESRNHPRQIVGNALVHAAAWGRSDVVADLLDRGADVDLIPAGFDFAGSAIHYAALRGRSEVVGLLLSRGADPGVPDAKIGRLPEHWAAHDGHHEIAAWLKRARENRRREPT